MDGPDDVDVLVKYERLGRQLRPRRRGGVRGVFAGFAGDPKQEQEQRRIEHSAAIVHHLQRSRNPRV